LRPGDGVTNGLEALGHAQRFEPNVPGQQTKATHTGDGGWCGGGGGVSRIVLASSCPYAATNAINVSLSTLEKIDASALMCTSGDVEEVEEEVEEVVEVEDGGGEQRFTISGGASFARFST
jgi:hypothetical protein